MDRSKTLTEGSIPRSIFKLAVPSMVSMVSIMMFEFVDLFWIGKLGTEAVAALGAASFVVWTLKSIAECVAAGLSALVSRNMGAGNFERIRMWASQGILLTVLFSIVIAISTYIFNLFLFDLLGLEPRVAEMARQYTFIMTIGLIFIFLTISLEHIFRATGNTVTPMSAIVTSLFLNAILDPFFIFGWCGFPRLGMPGGAVASVISHCLALLWLVKQFPIRIHIDFSAFLKNSAEIFRIGTPIGILGAVFSIIYIFISKNIAYFGTIPMAAISICHRIEGIPFFISFGFANAVSALVGQNLGAGKPQRAEKTAYWSLLYASIFLLLMSIIFIVRGKSILSWFIDDSAVIAEGFRYLFAVSIFEIFLGPEVILEGAFTGAGDTKPPFLISIPLTFLRIPLAYFFSVTLNYGVVAIWWVIGITTFLKGITFFLWFRRGRWKTKKIG